MSERNFRELYDLNQALSIGELVLEGASSHLESASLAMTGVSKHGKYKISRMDGRGSVRFGRPESRAGTVTPDSGDLIALSAGFNRRSLVALRYGIYDEELVIGYVQSDARLDTLDKYLEVKEELGARPHEFLVAQFFARVAPTLNRHPEKGVFIARHYVDKPVYPTLRDRFFDKNYALNPDRVRVRQILGEDNAWLSDEAVALRGGKRKVMDERVEEIREQIETLRSEKDTDGIQELMPQIYRTMWWDLFI